jgi:hypothetical protein
MSDTPTTFHAEPAGAPSAGWNDHAELHRADDGGGLLSGMKQIRSGTLAEMIRFVLTLPEAEQPHYAIAKSGDHVMRYGEILALARRSDYPG